MAATNLRLKSPVERPDVLILAGEHSGDEHAARLVRELRALKPDLRVAAVGGESLKAEGAELIFDLVEHSVIGFVEVLKQYGFFKALFHALREWVREHRPRHILLVDYPGFNLRFAAALKKAGLSRKGGGETGVWYYIAPQVWAWKAKRRFLMAEILDGLGCILPFEESFFGDTSLPVRFVGHPFVDPSYELPLGYDPEGAVLLLPGSRVQQINRVFPLQLEGFAGLRKRQPEVRGKVLYPSERIRVELENLLAGQPGIEGAIQLKRNVEGARGSAVLMSSGTMSLACALAGVPGAIVQRVQPLTYWMARRLVKIEFIGLANIILERPLIPEYIQQVDPLMLADELARSLGDAERIAAAREGAADLQERLSASGSHPAAEWVLECLEE